MKRLFRILQAATMLVGVASLALASDALVMDPDQHRIASEPAVAIDDTGATVVVWASQVAEGAQPLNGIRIRKFDSSGAAVGEMFRIDVLPGDLARKPSVDIAPDGSRFVVVWEGGTQGKRTKRRIWARVFDSEARPLGVEFRVDQRRMTHEQWGLNRDYYRDPKVSMAPNGEFVVVWRSEGTTSCDRFNISARRFSPAGEPLGNELIVNTQQDWSQINPDVDHDAAGGFVVVWQSGRFIGTNGEESRIFGRRFDVGGTARGNAVALSPDTLRVAALPSLVVAPSGDFGVAWRSGNGDDPLLRIAARVFDSTWTPMGELIEIEPESTGVGGPFVAIVREIELMVAWNGTAEDLLESPAVVAQVFNHVGVATSEVFPLSPATCWAVETPQVAGSHGFGAVVWRQPADDRILVRRYSGSDPLEDVPLVSGGLRFVDLVTGNSEALAGLSNMDGTRLERLFCLRNNAASAFGEFVRCATSYQGSSLCPWGIVAAADSPSMAIPPLLTVLKQDREGFGNQPVAACALGVFEEDASAAVPDLVAALSAESSHQRACATMSLGRIGSYSSAETMASALLGPQSTTRPAEVFSFFIRGLAELSKSEAARRAIERFEDAYHWRAQFLGDQTEGSFATDGTGMLAEYVRYCLKRRKIDDPRIVDWTIDQTLERFQEGWVDADEYNWGRDDDPGYDDADVMITRFVAIANLGPMKACDGPLAMAQGLSQVDPISDWAANKYTSLLRRNSDTHCLQDLLDITERMGPRGAPFAETIAKLLWIRDVSKISVIRVLKATDPGCEECVIQLKKLLSDSDSTVVTAAIDALIVAGPEAIWTCKIELTRMLVHEFENRRRLAEKALDLIEVEAAVCDSDWQKDPLVAPTPPVGTELVPGGSGWVSKRPAGAASPPPGSSAEPPRAIRTPVGGTTGKPKKPD